MYTYKVVMTTIGHKVEVAGFHLEAVVAAANATNAVVYQLVDDGDCGCYGYYEQVAVIWNGRLIFSECSEEEAAVETAPRLRVRSERTLAETNYLLSGAAQEGRRWLKRRASRLARRLSQRMVAWEAAI